MSRFRVLRPSPERFVLSALLTIALAPAAFALQPRQSLPDYVLDAWEIESGLPQNSVMTIVQTRDGYLWLGTLLGVARFDGVRFVVFNPENTPALRSDHIQALVEDEHGNLWIGTNGGGLTRMKDGRFENFSTSRGLPSNFIRALFTDRRGSLWIGTNGGLTRWKDGRFKSWGKKEGLSAEEVISVGADAEGNIWAGTYGGGVNRVDADGRVTSFTSAQGLANDRVWAVYTDRHGTLWLGTAGGLNRYDHGRFDHFTVTDGLPDNAIEALIEDREGNLWIGTRGGLARRQGNGGFDSLTSDDGLSDDFVRAIYEDREGNLWLGTYGGGLNRLKNRVVSTITKKEGLSENVTRTIHEDRRGAIWIGTYRMGVNRLENGRVSRYSKADGLSHDRVWTIGEASNGDLWFGTFGGGVARWNGRFAGGLTKEDGLPDNLVRSLYRDRAGTLWIGTDKGVAFLSNGRVSTPQVAGLPQTKVVAMFDDGRGRFWLGTDAGLWRLEKGAVTRYTAGEGLTHDLVYAIHGDADGTLWIGTAGGLTRRAVSGQMTRYTKRQGLFDDLVLSILDDGRGNLWMSSPVGIFRVSRKELEEYARGERGFITSIGFGKADGMKSSECNGGFQPAGLRARDGRLWFPTMRGVAIIDPSNVQTNERPPPVYIERVGVDGKAVSNGNSYAPGSRQFEFHYTGLSFTAPEKVRFKYRLEGYDRGWVDAGTRRVAYYGSIPPGRYLFRVAACNNDGVWNEVGASYAFTLRPAFHQTVWFYVSIAALAVVLGSLLYWLRVRVHTAREKQLLALVDQRTEEIQRERDEVEHLAYHDHLTQLPNRLLYVDRLEQAVSRANRRRESLAVLFLDLDHFKKVNDSLGHSIGDRLLVAVAGRLRAGLREADTVARLGGDEYTLLLENTGPDEAMAVARKVIDLIRLPIVIDAHELFVTTSAGLAVYPGDGDDAESLIKAADAAMYQAKEHGRDNCQLYTAWMGEQAAGHLAKESQLRKALSNGELLLHYQPLFSPTTGAVFGAEALIRWAHPRFGLIGPADFLRTATVSGLIVPIGAWVLETACAQARQWMEPLPDFRICVNLAARQFEQAGLVESVRKALAPGLDPNRLELEITEHDAMIDIESTLQTLRELKDLGVRISVDDFGTGYSSLSNLRQFPIDTVKLDQTFVRDLARSVQDSAIADAVIHLAHTLGLEVIAEGVETVEQLAFLSARRCDGAQGFYFSPAVPADVFTAQFVRNRKLLAQTELESEFIG
ncbi:MAG: EAL domain-containing protein [Thermoanaerobaculia bacterium]